MPSLLQFAQIQAQSGDGWWWSTLTSRPALMLLAIAAGCLIAMVYLCLLMRRTSPTRQPVSVRQRLASSMKDDSGVAMVEFVLVTPVLLFLTLVLVQTMLVFTGLFYVQYSAFAAARTAIVHIPMQSTEPINQIITERGSAKFDAIESSAMIALIPVSGQENPTGSPVAGQMVSGLSQAYSAMGRTPPPWIDGMLAQRLTYAMNHTAVEIERVLPGDSIEGVRFEPIFGGMQLGPKDAIAVTVQHEFALTVPLASKIFASVGESGTYAPASRNADVPAPPGQWTLLQARAILTNEGIDRRLPEQPSVPRLNN